MISKFIFCLIGIVPIWSNASIFNIDFELPYHNPGETVKTGVPKRAFTYVIFGDPKVESKYQGFQSSVLVFNMTGNSAPFYYDQASVGIPTRITDPIIRVSLKIGTDSLVGSLAAFSIIFDSPNINKIEFDNTGEIKVLNQTSNFPQFLTIGSFENNSVFNFTMEINTDEEIWTIFKNEEILGTYDFPIGKAVDDLRFSYGNYIVGQEVDESSLAIDDLVIETIPEPMSFSLIFGLTALLYYRRRG
jgi:hypothetical protein